MRPAGVAAPAAREKPAPDSDDPPRTEGVLQNEYEGEAERDGILMARRAPSLINMGDTLAVVADVVERLEV